MATTGTELDQLCINTIRCLAIDAVQAANSGHPGMPMGAAPMAYAIWKNHLKHNPTNPDWANRDRFILSPGHGCMLLYAMLHLHGYDVPLEDIKNFRQLGSKCPGHSEVGHTPGVDMTTGPLGQGLSSGVGMAMAEKYLQNYFGKDIIDHKIYGIVSDGDLMEGVASEAASLAGHLRLDNIIYLYDDNYISIEGHTTVAFTEDRLKRFEAYGWHTQSVEDGNDIEAIDAAIQKAKEVEGKPHLISVRTLIGYGSPNKADSHDAHGAPLGPDEVKLTKEAYGWDPEKFFHVPDEALTAFRASVEKGKDAEATWKAGLKSADAAKAAEFEAWEKQELPEGWDASLPTWKAGEQVPTRKAQSAILADIGPKLPMLLGGSADLAPSNNTYVKGSGDFQSPENTGDTGTYTGRNLHFGVREHAMGSAINGIALTKKLIPYGATFLVFSDYCKPAIRLSAFMGTQSIWIFTHDSIGLGEDGPTHQPVEHLSALRGIPGLVTLRPCDANEVTESWRLAVERRNGPTAIILTRQNVEVLERGPSNGAENTAKGGYVLYDSGDTPDIIFMSSGSETAMTLEAAKKIESEGKKVRVVAMPSMELFDQQGDDYKEQVLPKAVRPRVAVECGHSQSWNKYVGLDGACVTIDGFGASGPYEQLMEKFGFTVENVVANAKKVL